MAMKSLISNIKHNYIFTFFFAMTAFFALLAGLSLIFEQWFLSMSLTVATILSAIYAHVTYKPKMRG